MHPLLEALEPFAKLADLFTCHPDPAVLKIIGNLVKVEDIRRARMIFDKYNVTLLKATVEELEKILTEEDDTTGKEKK